MRINVTTPGGAAAGELVIDVGGVRTGFAYKCGDLFPPSRLVLQSAEGVLPVGVPVPEGGGTALRRSLTPLAMAGFDLSGPLRALLVPVGDPLPLPLAPAGDAPEGSPAEAPAQGGPEESPAEAAEPAPEDPAPAPEPPPESECAPEPECAPDPEPAPDPEAERPCRWCPEPDPARYFADPDLAASARRVSGVLIKAEGRDTLLAFPFSPSAPFPMLPAFRFGSAQEIDGGSYLVFRVRDGAPL